jgi:hypothetical protein
MGDVILMRHIDAFDDDMWYAKTAAFLVVWTMTMKICLGMVTVMMVLALYLKVDIIYSQYGVDQWEKRYRYFVYTSMLLVFILNIAYGSHLIMKANYDWEHYFTGFNVIFNAQYYGAWWGKILTFLGLFTGIQFGVLTILFTVILVKFIRLIGKPGLKDMNDFRGQKDTLKQLSYFFIGTFACRTLLSFMISRYDLFIPQPWTRWELWLVIGTVVELPNMFYTYLTHYQSFKEEDSDEAVYE